MPERRDLFTAARRPGPDLTGQSSAPRQLALDLPASTSFAAEDFLVGTSNEDAYGRIESWPAWSDRLLHLGGPPGSGKSHLAAMWASRSRAATVAASAIRDDGVPQLGSAGALVIEDIDRGPVEEAAVFHLVNIVRERASFLLFTSAVPLAASRLSTPDLVSRLRLAPSVTIEQPDDALLKAVLVKLFLDRQLVVDTSVIEFLATRIERSLAAARHVVAELDRESLSRGRRITRPIAAAILGKVGAVSDGGDGP